MYSSEELYTLLEHHSWKCWLFGDVAYQEAVTGLKEWDIPQYEK